MVCSMLLTKHKQSLQKLTIAMVVLLGNQRVALHCLWKSHQVVNHSIISFLHFWKQHAVGKLAAIPQAPFTGVHIHWNCLIAGRHIWWGIVCLLLISGTLWFAWCGWICRIKSMYFVRKGKDNCPFQGQWLHSSSTFQPLWFYEAYNDFWLYSYWAASLICKKIRMEHQWQKKMLSPLHV